MSRSIFNNTNTNTNFSDNITNDMTDYIIDFKSYDNLYDNSYCNLELYDNSMICQSCYSTVLSEKHANCCNTIGMYQMKKSIIDDNFIPMMTYGLGGCTAFIMINKNTREIMFAHHPDYKMIMVLFNNNYNSSDDFVLILKTPGSYVKEIGDEYWKLKSMTETIQRIDFNKPNVELNIVPYSLNDVYRGNDYNSTLYCKYVNKEFSYTDSNGNYNCVNL